MVKCSGCGLLYVNPVPDKEDIDIAMKTGLHKGETVLNVTDKFSELKVRDYLEKLPEIYTEKKFEANFEWLDVGCGYGELLIALKKFTKETGVLKGIEPNSVKMSEAKAMGLDVDFFDTRILRDKELDYVSLLNVYSHLPDPHESFTEFGRILKKGGEILVQTGDARGLNRKDLPGKLFLPDHLSFADERIVTEILKRTGFEILSVNRFHNPGYPKLSLKEKIFRQGKEKLRSIKHKNYEERNFFINTKRDMWIRAKKI